MSICLSHSINVPPVQYRPCRNFCLSLIFTGRGNLQAPIAFQVLKKTDAESPFWAGAETHNLSEKQKEEKKWTKKRELVGFRAAGF
jgi:hypothetical protein